jgi:hypothetical protein
MTSLTKNASTLDSTASRLYRLGGNAALAIGVAGTAAVVGVSTAVILNAVLATIWLFLVGYRLYRLGEQVTCPRTWHQS